MIDDMNDRETRWLESATGLLATLSLTLLPLFFLPLTQDFYETNKWMLLVGTSLAVLLLWAVTSAVSGVIKVSLSPAVAGLAAVTLSAAASFLVSSTNKIEALLSPLGITTWAGLTVLCFFCGHLITGPRRKLLLWLLLGGAAVAGLIAIYQFFGLGKIMFGSVAFLADPLWTPAGSSMMLLAWLALTFPLVIDTAMTGISQKKESWTIGATVIGLISLVAIGATLYQLVPLLPRVLLPLSDAWAIMLEVLKNPKNALFGVGTENFIWAFTAGRRLQMNAGPLWNVRFVTSSSLLFQIITVWGLIGAGATLILLRVLLPSLSAGKSRWSQVKNRGLLVAQLVAAVVVILMPPTITLLTIITILLLLTQDEDKYLYQWKVPTAVAWVRAGLVFVVALASVAAFYTLGRVYAAELTFYQSLLAAQRNNGTLTYNLQLRVTQLVPALSRYHVAFSQTNLALANTLANQATPSGQLNPEDRQLVTTFVAQSIREAKLAAELSPNNIIAWENLARTYQALTQVASGADAWAIASYIKAITLDPTNPILRINLGAMYVTQNNFDSAIQQFTFAANLKPDFANAYYNMAYTFRLKGDIPKAISALEQTLSLVASGSSDWVRVNNEIADLKKKELPSTSPSQPESLSTPSPLEPLIKPQISLPQDAGPNLATPSNQATPTAQ